MRRITIWLTATLSVVAMGTYYQVSLSGDGKADERQAAPAACVSTPPRTATTTVAATSTTTAAAAAACPEDEHSGKPGEQK